MYKLAELYQWHLTPSLVFAEVRTLRLSISNPANSNLELEPSPQHRLSPHHPEIRKRPLAPKSRSHNTQVKWEGGQQFAGSGYTHTHNLDMG